MAAEGKEPDLGLVDVERSLAEQARISELQTEIEVIECPDCYAECLPLQATC
jgi:hypothetical protein